MSADSFADHASPLQIRGVVLVPLDEDGLPCVESFIEMLYDAVPDDMVETMQADVPSKLPPEQAMHTDRLSITWGFLTNGIAASLLRYYGKPEKALDAFTDMLRTMVAQQQVEQEQAE